MERAEAIVRALADTGDPDKHHACILCGALRGYPHETFCAWRRARAWIAAHPRPRGKHARLPSLRG